MPLSPEAGRVLGCLVEKQLTTPQQYPLTLNALTLAANQATNRDPVVALDEETVSTALDELRAERLIRVVLPSHGRSVKRFRHVLDEVYGLDAPRYALLATLLLRGPQTVGELRARSERMVDFPSVDDVHDQLTVLAEHSEHLARLLPRQPGQKEDRWQQIMADPWGQSATTDSVPSDLGTEPDGRGDHGGTAPTPATTPAGNDAGAAELEALRSAVDSLRDEVGELRTELAALRHELEG